MYRFTKEIQFKKSKERSSYQEVQIQKFMPRSLYKATLKKSRLKDQDKDVNQEIYLKKFEKKSRSRDLFFEEIKMILRK